MDDRPWLVRSEGMRKPLELQGETDTGKRIGMLPMFRMT